MLIGLVLKLLYVLNIFLGVFYVVFFVFEIWNFKIFYIEMMVWNVKGFRFEFWLRFN